MIPLNDLRRQLRGLEEEISAAAQRVIDSGWYVLGREGQAFEKEFAEYCGVGHCVGVANGTDALEIALRALGCGAGDEVVTVANAGMYSSAGIIACGGVPVFADVDAASMTMTVDSLSRAIGPKTKVIVVTHLYGQLADVEALAVVAARSGVPILEDCAQAHGASRTGRRAGSFGAAGCFSFYPTKNLGALGDGGAIVTQSAALAEKIRSLRQYGWASKYVAVNAGGRNSRLDEIQAAILRVKLPRLDQWNARRRDVIDRYRRSSPSTIVLPDVAGPDTVAHLCVARCSERASLANWLAECRIASEIHYPLPDHQQSALAGKFRTVPGGLPETERLAGEILTLPCFPELEEDEIAHVCASLAAFAP
jgi:dTDP-4-amino-4,6-dideoxygalactose transaminase